MDVSHSRPFTRGRFHPDPRRKRSHSAPIPAHNPRRYLIKLPAAGSDKYIKEDKGPEAGDRYKKAKYGGPDSDDEAPRRSRVHTEERKSASPRSSPTRAATRTSLPTSTYSSRSPSGSSERCSARCPVRRAWAAAARRSARNASLSWKASFPSRSGRCLRDGVQFRRSRCDASRSCPP